MFARITPLAIPVLALLIQSGCNRSSPPNRAAATALQTRDKEIDIHGDLTYDSHLTVKQALPLPFILQGIIPKYEVTGK